MLYLLLALFTAAIVAVDQLTKYLAAANLVGKTVTLIPGWLQLHYITNDGMALSLLRGARWLFVVMTAVYLAVVIYVLVKKWFKKTPELWCIAAITGGAIVGFIIAYCLAGFVVGLVVLVAVVSTGIALIMLKQRKGLHTKKDGRGVYIYAHSKKL